MKRPPRLRSAVTSAELMRKLLERHGLAEEVREHRLVTEWRSLVGERVAARTWPGRVRDGLLMVRVSNSAWLSELSFFKDALIERINQRLGDPPLVREIRLHLGKPPRGSVEEVDRAHARTRRAPLRARPLPPPATGADLQRIQGEVAAVEDDELRDEILEARRKLNL